MGDKGHLGGHWQLHVKLKIDLMRSGNILCVRKTMLIATKDKKNTVIKQARILTNLDAILSTIPKNVCGIKKSLVVVLHKIHSSFRVVDGKSNSLTYFCSQ